MHGRSASAILDTRLSRRRLVQAGAAGAAGLALGTVGTRAPHAGAAYPPNVVWYVDGLVDNSVPKVAFPDNADDGAPVGAELHSPRWYSCTYGAGAGSYEAKSQLPASHYWLYVNAERIFRYTTSTEVVNGVTQFRSLNAADFPDDVYGYTINECIPHTQEADRMAMINCETGDRTTKIPGAGYHIDSWHFAKYVILPLVQVRPGKRVVIYISDPAGVGAADAESPVWAGGGHNYRLLIQNLLWWCSSNGFNILPYVKFGFECYTKGGTGVIANWLPTLIGYYGTTWDNLAAVFSSGTYGPFRGDVFKANQPTPSLRPPWVYLHTWAGSTRAGRADPINRELSGWH